MADEKLIDALAKIQCAIEGRTHGFSLDEVVAPGIERWTRHRYEAEILLRDIREAGYVFEKAHTPTDDERTRACWVDRYGQDHHTPTNDEREALAQVVAKADEETLDYERRLPDYYAEPWEGYMLHADHILAAGFRRTVQGEPTDAQVLAALNAWYAKEREQYGMAFGFDADDLARYSPQSQDRMRAALRAAAATQEGENRG